jgi:arsenite oxidase small subunit
LTKQTRQDRRRVLLGVVSWPVLAAAGRAVAADGPPLAVIDQKALAEPWTTAEFSFELEGELVPGIIVKLPGERWYASSLICPHAKCVAKYFRDVTVAQDTFDVVVKNPVLGCPCHFSVFDVANGGKVISGPAPNPPQQFTVEVRDGKLFVSR